MSGISTHVLDTSRGKPAPGIAVVFEVFEKGSWKKLAGGITDSDGRIASLLADGPPAPGDYQLRFSTGDYFHAVGDAVFYPEVTIRVRFAAAGGKFHLPLLLSPFGYTTYRGS